MSCQPYCRFACMKYQLTRFEPFFFFFNSTATKYNLYIQWWRYSMEFVCTTISTRWRTYVGIYETLQQCSCKNISAFDDFNLQFFGHPSSAWGSNYDGKPLCNVGTRSWKSTSHILYLYSLLSKLKVLWSFWVDEIKIFLHFLA